MSDARYTVAEIRGETRRVILTSVPYVCAVAAADQATERDDVDRVEVQGHAGEQVLTVRDWKAARRAERRGVGHVLNEGHDAELCPTCRPVTDSLEAGYRTLVADRGAVPPAPDGIVTRVRRDDGSPTSDVYGCEGHALRFWEDGDGYVVERVENPSGLSCWYCVVEEREAAVRRAEVAELATARHAREFNDEGCRSCEWCYRRGGVNKTFASCPKCFGVGCSNPHTAKIVEQVRGGLAYLAANDAARAYQNRIHEHAEDLLAIVDEFLAWGTAIAPDLEPCYKRAQELVARIRGAS